jgi:transposase-like protein
MTANSKLASDQKCLGNKGASIDGIDICHESIRFWWNRFGPMFAAEIRKRRVHHRSYSNWRWHLDDVFVRINGETHYLSLLKI